MSVIPESEYGPNCRKVLRPREMIASEPLANCLARNVHTSGTQPRDELSGTQLAPLQPFAQPDREPNFKGA